MLKDLCKIQSNCETAKKSIWMKKFKLIVKKNPLFYINKIMKIDYEIL